MKRLLVPIVGLVFVTCAVPYVVPAEGVSVDIDLTEPGEGDGGEPGEHGGPGEHTGSGHEHYLESHAGDPEPGPGDGDNRVTVGDGDEPGEHGDHELPPDQRPLSLGERLSNLIDSISAHFKKLGLHVQAAWTSDPEHYRDIQRQLRDVNEFLGDLEGMRGANEKIARTLGEHLDAIADEMASQQVDQGTRQQMHEQVQRMYDDISDLEAHGLDDTEGQRLRQDLLDLSNNVLQPDKDGTRRVLRSSTDPVNNFKNNLERAMHDAPAPDSADGDRQLSQSDARANHRHATRIDAQTQRQALSGVF